MAGLEILTILGVAAGGLTTLVPQFLNTLLKRRDQRPQEVKITLEDKSGHKITVKNFTDESLPELLKKIESVSAEKKPTASTPGHPQDSSGP
jgi:hypothetical protein